MGDIVVRRGVSSDVPSLKALWSSVFGDSDADIDAFFETFFDVSVCVIAEAGETLAAMGFLLPVGFLRVPGKGDVPCGMIYAVATEPAMRGRGCGEAVTRGLLDAAAERGIPAVALCPAEDSLFGFYEQRTELETAFYCKEERISISPRDGAALCRVTAAEYIAIREEILKDTPHITFDERCFSYQERLCAGGGLFTSNCDDDKRCCAAIEAVYSTDTDAFYVRIIELLGVGERLLQGVAREFHTEECLVRRPGNDLRFGMLNAGFSIQSAWFGLAFD